MLGNFVIFKVHFTNNLLYWNVLQVEINYLKIELKLVENSL